LRHLFNHSFEEENTVTSAKLKRAVGVFPDRLTTASALQALKDSGFAMSQVSVVARDGNREGSIAGVKVLDRSGNHAQAGAAAGAYTGGVLGSVAGLLLGLGALTIPALAPFLIVGELTALGTAVVGAIAGAAAGSLIGALIGMGVPADRAHRYGDRVARGDYLVMLKGTEREIQRAEGVLQRGGVQDWGVYNPSGASATIVRSAPDSLGPTVASVESPRVTGTLRPIAASPQPMPHQSVRPNLPPVAIDPAATDPMTQLPNRKRAIGVFRDRQSMAAAVDTLRHMGFPMHKLSFVMRDTESINQVRQAVRGTDTTVSRSPDHALGGVTDLLAGLHRVTLPGIGVVLVAGAEANDLAANLSQGAIAGGNLTNALANLGIPQAQAKAYAEQVSQGACLVTVRAAGDETLHAAAILNQGGMRDWGVYDAVS
jgi:hypothetical protein